MINNSLCIFSTYFETETFPLYVKTYLNELLNYFEKIIIVTNDNKTLSLSENEYVTKNNFEIKYVKNQGWDFGMWTKVLKDINMDNYSSLGLINDSCILLRKIDDFFYWAETNNLDYFGMLDSPQRHYHIQSYFLIIRNKALNALLSYFSKTGILNEKADVINHYEIGLSQHMIQKGIKVGAYFSYKKYYENNPEKPNPLHGYIGALMSDNFPLLKKERLWQLHQKRLEFLKNENYNIFFDKDVNFKIIQENLEKINSVFDIIEKNNVFYSLNDYVEQAVFFESFMNKQNKKNKFDYFIEKVKKRLKFV
ncbi:MAG: hypothetical protein JXR68_06140 [Bacteroidales bacterium]|nr:hypothetical protein [Bacteroidales bacterium]